MTFLHCPPRSCAVGWEQFIDRSRLLDTGGYDSGWTRLNSAANNLFLLPMRVDALMFMTEENPNPILGCGNDRNLPIQVRVVQKRFLSFLPTVVAAAWVLTTLVLLIILARLILIAINSIPHGHQPPHR